jgi:hypothetical protein
LDLLQEYLAIGAVVELVCPQSLSVPQFLDQWGVRHLVPWFVISKAEGTSQKHRLITDCRKVNRFLQAPHFKMDHWGQIFPFVRRGMWACKVDLKHAYFHLPLAKKIAGISGFAGERQIFSVSGSPIRSKPFTFLVDPSDENLGQGLETKGYQQFCVPGRRFGVGKKSKQVGKGHGLRPGHFSPVGSSNKLQEKCSATNPKSATFGFPFGLGKRPPPSAGGKNFPS